MAHVIVFGHIGSDAGYWEFVNGKLVHVPGWAPEALAEVATAARMLSAATALKNPDVVNKVAGVLSDFVDREVSSHTKAGAGATTVVILAG